MTAKLSEFISIDDFQAYAQLHLTKRAFDYYISGSDDMQTLQDNCIAYSRYRLRPQILKDVSTINTTINLFGHILATPICIAPTAMQRMAHDEGEIATATSTRRANTCMILSSWSTTSLEDVITKSVKNLTSTTTTIQPASPLFWFQLYIYKDRKITLNLIQRAEKSGYKAIVVTVDTPYLGKRRADIRNRFELPPGLTMANFTTHAPQAHVDSDNIPATASGLSAYVASQIDPSITWHDIAWIQSATSLPVIVKGILSASDACKAVNANVAGIIVSNHGGRQLDSTLATIDVLEEVVNAVDKKLPVFVDGGIRRGTDVLKAIALGAHAVFVGRPVLWGLAFDGSYGVDKVLQLLNEEFRLAMALTGCSKLSDITRDLVVGPLRSSHL